jgi:hypothetical protein
MSEALPTYDPSTPAQPQDADYDCSQESAQWCLRSWGRNPDDAWMTQSLIDQGVMTPQYGLMDASGAGMADWLNREYGEFGYVASNEPSVTFDQVANEAAEVAHPLMIGGRAFYHWVGCSGWSSSGDVLLLANSALGYKGVWDTLSRAQWAQLGPWSLVRLQHPAAEGLSDTVPPGLSDTVPPDLSAWEPFVGSGLLQLMAEDGTEPAQSASTWLPLGGQTAETEMCLGKNMVTYIWSLTVNQGARYRPA